jgi:hypothetical protein
VKSSEVFNKTSNKVQSKQKKIKRKRTKSFDVGWCSGFTYF